MKGIATHTDRESCGAATRGGNEALTGARAGSDILSLFKGKDDVGLAVLGHLDSLHEKGELRVPRLTRMAAPRGERGGWLPRGAT